WPRSSRSARRPGADAATPFPPGARPGVRVDRDHQLRRWPASLLPGRAGDPPPVAHERGVPRGRRPDPDAAGPRDRQPLRLSRPAPGRLARRAAGGGVPDAAGGAHDPRRGVALLPRAAGHADGRGGTGGERRLGGAGPRLGVPPARRRPGCRRGRPRRGHARALLPAPPAPPLRASPPPAPPPARRPAARPRPGLAATIVTELAELGALARVFGRLGLLAFGGGLGVLPEMERQAVEIHGWVTHREFVDAFAFSQVTPGPGMLMVVVIGFRTAGLAGAAPPPPRAFRPPPPPPALLAAPPAPPL